MTVIRDRVCELNAIEVLSKCNTCNYMVSYMHKGKGEEEEEVCDSGHE